MNNQSSNQGLSGVFIGLGVLLMVLGALFVVVQAVGFDLGRFAWPFFVIVPGLAVLGAGLAATGPWGWWSWGHCYWSAGSCTGGGKSIDESAQDEDGTYHSNKGCTL
jgi:hypothetical protein